MNAEFLLAHFDRISDAPDAVAQLRKLIYRLAVAGKLVGHESADGSVSELVQLIRAEKRQRMNVANAKKAQLALSDAKAIPIGSPQHWAWLRLCDVGALSGGMTPSKNRADFWGGEINWFSPKDIKANELFASELKISAAGVKETGLQLYPPGCLFIVARSGILKRTLPVSINRVEATANQDLKVLNPFVPGMERYLQIMFIGMTDFILSALVKTGTTVQSLKYEEFESQPIPLPPLPEQHRIVAKVDELMALCDRLETAQRDRESRRDRLTAATHHHLNNGADAEALRGHSQFFIGHLPRLTARPDQIKQLRQTILNFAVRGKLVPQNPGDGPICDVLKQIRREQDRLIREGAIPKRKPVQRKGSENAAIARPENWATVEFGGLCNIVTSGSRGWAEYYSDSGPRFIRAQNIRFGKLLLDDLACVNPPNRSEGTRTQVTKGDLLIVITGAGVTNPAQMEEEMGESYVSQHVALAKPTNIDLSPWLLLFLMADAGGRADLIERAYGSGKPGLNLDNIRSLSTPLPPLAEQHRIVAKVDELMALCDRLESRLTAAQTEASRLLESVLHHALQASA